MNINFLLKKYFCFVLINYQIITWISMDRLTDFLHQMYVSFPLFINKFWCSIYYTWTMPHVKTDWAIWNGNACLFYTERFHSIQWQRVFVIQYLDEIREIIAGKCEKFHVDETNYAKNLSNFSEQIFLIFSLDLKYKILWF